ncbi:MAG: carbamoyl-phosphate synthase large subunit [Desulfovibrio sp.]|jgi:carbamoyl-phosphate synthase large subunit|nr:carbamoyl-phosphate synthase large subunit [Desulfovibrio sp.]
MPKRADIKSVLVLGSGPIIIGQACEFDYSGTQGCKALKEEGCRIILLNSNPATVMTDPGFSERTYMEPMDLDIASSIIRMERPDALLPTLGGQTALNLAVELHRSGVLRECGVEMIGAGAKSIEIAEDRELFSKTMRAAGLDLPKNGIAASLEEALRIAGEIAFPLVIRPSFTLGGTGGGLACNMEEFRDIVRRGLDASPIGRVLVEESVLGWKEIELEVMRDGRDNAVVICGIENFDPMGVHTGDSITVAPIQTLTDVEYQELRNDALTVVRAVGVDTGGCNIQFAVNPQTGRRVIIEMNPRVSRSSALASKATGFPIARVAAKLALGYHLDELKNDITGTSACFEPTIDYCVVKVPRFNFEKFAGAKPVLGLQMHSVGETMALGGNFREALQKALRGLETGLSGLEPVPVKGKNSPAHSSWEHPEDRLDTLRDILPIAGPERLMHLYEAIVLGLDLKEANSLTGIDPWFLIQLAQIAATEKAVCVSLAPQAAALLASGKKAADVDKDGSFAAFLRRIKAQGFSDARLAVLLRKSLGDASLDESQVRALRHSLDVRPVFRCVDTCAGEFKALTPYFYSTYDGLYQDPAHLEHVAACGARSAPQVEGKVLPGKVIILGGGPNRIGQGVEFDYCCVQAAWAMKDLGITSILVNSNPETVSTDYDTADRLYFEPVTIEDVLAVCEAENLCEEKGGLIVQLGGQTPLNIASALEAAGVPILGTSPKDIALAEDREEFSALARRLGINQTPSGMAGDSESVCRIAGEIGYPVMVRPSFVLGGRAMRVIHREADLRDYVSGRENGFVLDPASPILVDKFLEDAVEVDVDAVCDGRTVSIAAIMEHIEQAGIHSGDSCCSIPTHTLEDKVLERIRSDTRKLGLGLNTVGLLNVQFAIRTGKVFVLEANPRASRTVPFVSKATGQNVAGAAAGVMAGLSLAGSGFIEEKTIACHAVKEAVIPFTRFPGAEISLGPEMRSTGEVMGIDRSFGMAFLKSQSASGAGIPASGNVVLTVTDKDKEALIPLAARLKALGFNLFATPGTGAVLSGQGIDCELLVKIGPRRPHLLDFMRDGKTQLMVNTVSGSTSARDATAIRAEALTRNIPLLTTLSALSAAVEGLEVSRRDKRSVAPLQDYYAGLIKTGADG